jgi:hypothetical protein
MTETLSNVVSKDQIKEEVKMNTQVTTAVNEETESSVQERVISLKIIDNLIESSGQTASEFIDALKEFINGNSIAPSAKFSTICREYNNSKKGVVRSVVSKTDYLKNLVRSVLENPACVIKGEILKIQNSRKNIEHAVYSVKIKQELGESIVTVHMKDLTNVQIYVGTVIIQKGISLIKHPEFAEAQKQLEVVKEQFVLDQSIHKGATNESVAVLDDIDDEPVINGPENDDEDFDQDLGDDEEE